MVEPSPLPATIQPLDVLDIVIRPAQPPIDIAFSCRCNVEPDGNVLLGPEGRVNVKGLTLEQAEVKLADPRMFGRPSAAQVKFARRLVSWREAILPKAPYTIRPGDVLSVDLGPAPPPSTAPQREDHLASPEQSLGGNYLVEDEGTISFGPAYGRVKLSGLTLEAAEVAVREKLTPFFGKHIVQVTLPVCRHPDPTYFREAARPKAPYTIKSGTLLHIIASESIGHATIPIPENLAVEPGGTLALGAMLGRVNVQGMSLEEAQRAIQRKLQKDSKENRIVLVTLAGWMDLQHCPETEFHQPKP